MISCKKTYSDIPWAHRQHKHDGQCALIHGHNWSITFTFACAELDENGFVIDFGKLQFIKEWITANLDHACVFAAEDPLMARLLKAAPGAWRPYVVPNCSCEGMAQHLFEVLDPMVTGAPAGRAYVTSVEVTEDSKNSAMYTHQGDEET